MLEYFKDTPIHFFNRVADIEKLHILSPYMGPCYKDLNMIRCSYATHMCVVSAVASLIAVTEVILVTSSDKKEFKGKYWREWLTI